MVELNTRHCFVASGDTVTQLKDADWFLGLKYDTLKSELYMTDEQDFKIESLLMQLPWNIRFL